MDFTFHVNPQLSIPIYQQLVDTIRTAIKSGSLPNGQKLPTVQELSAELSIARGTIKRAYDELALAGFVEKIQGRGTFVSYQPASSGSRKEQAMAAIDSLLTQLEEMGFSAGEIHIFLNLKLRERAEQGALVKAAVLECHPETLSRMTQQLRQLGQVELYTYLLDAIQEYPYKLPEDVDFIVTTAKHASDLERILPVGRKIIRVALRLSPPCFSEIIRLRKGVTVGILGYSQRFCRLLHDTCLSYTDGVNLLEPVVFSPELDLDRYLQDKDAVLVPTGYEACFSPQAGEKLREFSVSRKLIPCHYEMDEGSSLYLKLKIQRILEEKTI